MPSTDKKIDSGTTGEALHDPAGSGGSPGVLPLDADGDGGSSSTPVKPWPESEPTYRPGKRR